MKHVAQNYKTGELAVLDVPEPACRPGGVLVRTLYSLISTGTEMMKVSEARLSLVGKAKARPDQVRKVLDSVAQQGPMAAYRKAMGKLDSYTPLGYSLAGVVTEVGEGAEGLAVGDLVACAGNEFALHAELNWVPTNLCVKVPDGVAAEHAAFATVGAIAMQGVRRGEMQLGETACVIGLGLVGQLVVRLLVASGVRVVGVDTVPERCRLAEKAGAILAAGPDAEGTARLERALAVTGPGVSGADVVFLAAGGHTNGPVELAVALARDRGRVVDIGKTRLDLPWNAYYEKELDVRFSRSYGPGRYDDRYELDGLDYPPGYVRWTERRNLACFLDLIAAESLEVASLVDGVHPVSEAATVYERLRTGELKGIGFLFGYPAPEPARAAAFPHTSDPGGRVPSAPRPSAPLGKDRVGIGFIGAGGYASSMLLPHLAQMASGTEPAAYLHRVATTRSLSAANAERAFGFAHTSTAAEEVLTDPEVDAVFVVTRHHSHAAFVCRALEAGKAVFVEKPLALTEEQVAQILATVEETGNDRLMVGFNRRFAPLVDRLRAGLGEGPRQLRYLVNAGSLGKDSWYLDTAREGSRWAGEGGHFVDTVSALVGADPVSVTALATGDDRHVTLEYADGSVGQIAYLTGGSRRFPKETLDATGAGRNARLDDFTRVTVWRGREKDAHRSLRGQDKGQRAMLAAFVDACRTGAPMPVPLDSLVATTRATLAAEVSGRTELRVLTVLTAPTVADGPRP